MRPFYACTNGIGRRQCCARESHVPRDTVLIFEHLRDLVLRKKMRCSMSHLIMLFVLLLYLQEVSEMPRTENCVSGDMGHSGCAPLLSVRRGRSHERLVRRCLCLVYQLPAVYSWLVRGEGPTGQVGEEETRLSTCHMLGAV